MLLSITNNYSSISIVKVAPQHDKVLFGFATTNRSIVPAALGKDSDFETDPDKAREALRRLDDQLQSLSTKQPPTPKIRAGDVKQRNLRGREEADEEEIQGSFLGYTASFLLVFTIIYNLIFLTLIKPAVDGPETPQYSNQPSNSSALPDTLTKTSPSIL